MSKALVFIVLGLVILYGSLSELRIWLRMRRRVRRAAGVIVGVKEETILGDRPMRGYAAVFRFVTEDGAVVEAVSSAASSPGPRVGRRITVVYDPADPHRTAERAGVWKLKVVLIPLLLVLGVGLVVFGLTFLR